MWFQVMRILLPICLKAYFDGSLGRETARGRNRAAIREDPAPQARWPS
jgi:hypothetical protein